MNLNLNLIQICGKFQLRGVSENRDNMAAGPVSERNQGRLDPWLRVDAVVVS